MVESIIDVASNQVMFPAWVGGRVALLNAVQLGFTHQPLLTCQRLCRTRYTGVLPRTSEKRHFAIVVASDDPVHLFMT